MPEIQKITHIGKKKQGKEEDTCNRGGSTQWKDNRRERKADGAAERTAVVAVDSATIASRLRAQCTARDVDNSHAL